MTFEEIDERYRRAVLSRSADQRPDPDRIADDDEDGPARTMTPDATPDR
jgi:hypothetical protein